MCHRSHSLTVLLIAAITLSLLACGGGGNTTPPQGTYKLSGRVQKGPFTVGSAVNISEQSPSLAPTGKVYDVQISDVLGDFAVPSGVDTPQVEIIAQGFYFDELTAQLSASQITLRAIADLSMSSSPTVNILTTLQEQRLKALISQGSTFAAAATQSEKEVLALFGIDSTKVNALPPLASMRIDSGADADSVLLAASAILSQMATDAATANGTTQAAELSNLVNTLAGQLAASGTVTTPTFIAARNRAESEINVATVTSNLQTYYANNGATVVVPKFQEWLDPSNSGVLPQRLVPVSGLTFIDVMAASPGQSVTSNSVTVAGVGSGVVAPVSVSGGTALSKNGVVVTGQLSTVMDGDIIALRVTAPGYGLTTRATISAGTSSAAWNVTSQPLSGTVTGLTGTGLVLQVNGANNITIAPGSASFNFPTTLVNGASYNVTVLTEPAAPPLQVCVVYNGTGTVGGSLSNISVGCTTPSEQLIVADLNGNFSAYFIDSRTGSLGAGAPVALGSGYTQQATDPAGKFLYVLNTSAATVSAFTASASTGALMPVAGSPFPTSAGPSGLVVEPTGRFVYVGGSSGADAYSIDPTTGTLTLIAGSPFRGPPGSTVVCGLFCLANAKFLYYPQWITGGIGVNAFAIDAMTGALTSIGPVGATAETAGADHAALDPAKGFFYLDIISSVQVYTVNALTGALTYVTTVQPPSPSFWTYMTLDPTGKFAYMPLGTSDVTAASSISVYAIDATTGTLSPLSSNTIAAGVDAVPVVFDLTGKFVYVGNISSYNISAYAINPTTGALTPVPGSPFPTAVTPANISVTKIP
jgi:6-phosphogluconolactonase (cycloisomerase 2 family)